MAKQTVKELKQQALLAYQEKLFPHMLLSDLETFHKPNVIKNYLQESYSFNSAFKRDFEGVNGKSKEFWERVIKWCN